MVVHILESKQQLNPSHSVPQSQESSNGCCLVNQWNQSSNGCCLVNQWNQSQLFGDFSQFPQKMLAVPFPLLFGDSTTSCFQHQD